MAQRFFAAAIAIAILSLTPMSIPSQTRSAATTWSAPRTADKQPDLQGIWTNGTVTPLERPPVLAEKQFFSPKEAAEYERQARERNDGDRRDNNPEADLAVGYNDF